MRAIILTLMLTGAVFAEDVSIPVVGQPSPFFGAAGRGVIATASVEPTQFTRDESCILSLKIAKVINPTEVKRPAFEDLGEFAKDFQAENLPEGPAKDGERVFRYRLRPRKIEVTEIPVIVFPYYDPNVPQPPDMPGLPFRKARTDSIPIKITKPAAPPAIPVTPLVIPAFAEKSEVPAEHWQTPQKALWAIYGIQISGVLIVIALWRFGPSRHERRSHRLRRLTTRTVRQLEQNDLTLDQLSRVMRDYQRGLPADTAITEEQWNTLWSRIDESRFAPANLSSVESIRVEALRLVRRTGEDL